MSIDKSRSKTVFVCSNCGRESLKWVGRCPACQEWNTYQEKAAAPSNHWSQGAGGKPQELSQVSSAESPRLSLPLAEFNRVLGGGIVPGSLILIGGDPGIGKSTLLLRVAHDVACTGGKVVYVSGEESLPQIKLRAERLGIPGDRIFLLPETHLETILGYLEETMPRLVIVDSIQTVYAEEIPGAPGSVSQVRECTLRLMRWAKPRSIPMLLSGHVTKEGSIAGPRVLEHIVDAVLSLEGEPFSAYRVLRGIKNRFGSTNEVGVFEMSGQGLIEVENPSLAFLGQRQRETVGSAVVPALEGTRPLMVEVQALTTPTAFGFPRRTANGVDFNRLILLAAVLSKRAGLALGTQDIIVNAAGGLKIDEPAADLAICLAIASSFRDVPIDPDLVPIAEVGLSGELRRVPQLERRLNEAARLGFQRCLIPRAGPVPKVPGVEIVAAGSLREALRAALRKDGRSVSQD